LIGAFGKTWTPERRQGEHAECGLAALAIAMGFHGVHVPLHQLRKDAGSTLYGSTARTLRDLARHHGFAASAHRVEIEAMADLGFPLVAHSRFVHFVVVEKISAAGIHINDPASGPEIVDRERFSRDFTGIVIRLAPGAVQQGKAYSAFTHYLQSFSGDYFELGAATACTVLGAVSLSCAIAQFSGSASAALAGATEVRWEWPVLLALAVLADIAALRLVVKATTGAARGTSGAILKTVPSWPSTIFLLRNSGQAIARVSAPLTLQTPSPLVAVLALFYAAIVSAGSITISAVPGLLVAGLLVLQVALLLALSLRRGGVLARHGSGALPHFGFSPRLFAHPDWWQVGHGGQSLFNRIAGHHALSASHALRAAAAQIRLDIALRLIDLIKYALLIALLLSAETPEIAGQLLGLLAVAGIGNLALQRAGRGLQFLPIKNALHRISDTIDIPEPHGYTNSGGKGLELKAVSWRPAEIFDPLFAPVTMTLAPGQMLAISGGAENAKTALARICAGLLSPHQGHALLDGVPMVETAPQTSILLGHHTALRTSRLRENMTLGSSTLPDEMLQDALEAVELWLTLAMRGGLDLELDEEGSMLSGGQLRRLALARALCRQPRIMVLDGILDSVEVDLARRIVDRLRARGIILVLVSLQPELVALADHHLTLQSIQ